MPFSSVALRIVAFVLAVLSAAACENTNQESVARALEHASTLVEVSRQDVAEIRNGLPLGARELGKLWASGSSDLTSDAQAARDAVNRARDKVQDLRVAKSTFFALAGTDGVVIRNDQEQDLMAGKSLLEAFPALARARDGGYVEAIGVMPEAHGVRGKPDGEWIAAHGVTVGERVQALYVTGWAWSSYAYRLEFSLRNRVTSELKGQRANVPLLYAFVLVGDQVYGAPESPVVNAESIARLQPLKHLDTSGSFSSLLEITGRTFALGVRAAPALGDRVAIGVLRSET